MKTKKRFKNSSIIVMLIAFVVSVFSVSFTLAFFSARDEASGVIVMGDAVNVIIKGNEQHNYRLFDMDQTTGLLPGSKVHVNDIILKISRTNTPMTLRVKLDVSSNAQSLISMIYDRMGIETANWHYHDGWFYYVGAGVPTNSYVMVSPAENGGSAGSGQLLYNDAVYSTTRGTINPLDGSDIVVSSVWNTASDFEIVFSQTPTKSFRIPTDLTSAEIANEHLLVDITVEAIQDFLIIDDENVLPTIGYMDYLLYPEATPGLEFAYVVGNKNVVVDFDDNWEPIYHTMYGVNGYELIGIGSAQGSIVVPPYYNDGVHGTLPVIGIGENAISENHGQNMIGNASSENYVNSALFAPGDGTKKVTSVKLPEGILWIDAKGIFSNAIDKIKLPNSLKILGFSALSNEHGEYKIKSLDLGTGLETLGVNAFAFNNLSYLVLPSSLNASYWTEQFDTVNNNFTNKSMTVVNLSSVSDEDLPKELKSTSNSGGSIVVNNLEAAGSVRITPNKVIERVDDDGSWIIGYAGNAQKLYFANYTSGNWKIAQNAFNGTYYEQITFGAGITEIGNYAFANMYNLTNIRFVEGLKSIGNNAFLKSKIQSVSLPSSVEIIGHASFSDNKITTLKLNEGLKTISQQAFDKNLIESVTIPNSVINMAASTFANNVTLTKLVIGNGLTTIAASQFKQSTALKSVVIGTGITTLPSKIFQNFSLESVVWHNGITEIGDNAFENNNLKTLVMPNGLTKIGKAAFKGNNITSLTLNNNGNLTTFGDEAFNGNLITKLTIPNSVTALGASTFRNNKINSLTLGSGITQLFGNVFLDNEITNLTIPNGVTSIGPSAFKNNKIRTLTIPNSVTTISAAAFQNNLLTVVNLGNSVEKIMANAFADNNISQITIPNSVARIESSAFKNNNISTIKIGTSFDSGQIIFKSNAFENNPITNITIYKAARFDDNNDNNSQLNNLFNRGTKGAYQIVINIHSAAASSYGGVTLNTTGGETIVPFN